MQNKPTTPEYEEYNATLEDDAAPDTAMNADEVQESILEDSDMSGFQKTIARFSEKAWTRIQLVIGALLGLATGIALFWNGGSDNEQGFSYSLIVAIVIAMLIPNLLERKGLRRIPKLRIALVVVLAVMIVLYFIYFAFVKGMSFTA